MKYSIKVSENHATVFLNDEKFANEALLLRGDLLQIIDQGVTDLRMELSGLSYIDGSILETLVIINKRNKEKNGRMVLMGTQGLLFDKIKRTRLEKFFTIQ